MIDERVALVTAGGSGMGAAAARKLAGQGFRVGVLSSSGQGEALADELGGFGVTDSKPDPAAVDSADARKRIHKPDPIRRSGCKSAPRAQGEDTRSS